MTYKVFISHSSKDTWVAKQIERHLQECGAHTFLDAHMDDYLQQLKQRVYEKG